MPALAFSSHRGGSPARSRSTHSESDWRCDLDTVMAHRAGPTDPRTGADFVPSLTGATRPQQGRGLPVPTPSNARRVSATPPEGPPPASSAAAPRSEDRRARVALGWEPATLPAAATATRSSTVGRPLPKLAAPSVRPPPVPVLHRSAHSLSELLQLRWWVGTACARPDHYRGHWAGGPNHAAKCLFLFRPSGD